MAPDAAGPADGPGYWDGPTCDVFAEEFVDPETSTPDVEQFLTPTFRASLSPEDVRNLVIEVYRSCSALGFSPISASIVQVVVNVFNGSWSDIAVRLPSVSEDDLVAGSVVFPARLGDLRLVGEAELYDFWLFSRPDKDAAVNICGLGDVGAGYTDPTATAMTAVYSSFANHLAVAGCSAINMTVTHIVGEQIGAIYDGAQEFEGLPCLPGGSVSNDTCVYQSPDSAVWLIAGYAAGSEQVLAGLLREVLSANGL